jgi:hypothetical protein
VLAVLLQHRLKRSAGSRRPLAREALQSGIRQLRVHKREMALSDQPGGELEGVTPTR